MRLVSVRQEALYRGYRIEGAKEGECLLLHVIPLRADLPRLAYSRFRTLPHGTWPKALGVVYSYIDRGFKNTDDSRSRVDKLLRLRDHLLSELDRRDAPPMPEVGPSPQVTRLIK